MTVAQILEAVASGKLKPADAAALMPKSPAPAKVSLKISEKGGVSVYGMGRFPVTLYREQWERLFAHREQIEAFIAANAASLKAKGE